MYQNNYNGYQQFNRTLPSQQNVPVGLKGRPVSSLDEARAAQVDFDGSVFFFPDIANKRIYTKQINLDGTASLNIYEFSDVPVVEQQYVTKEEFDATLVEIKDLLNQMREPTKVAAKTEEKVDSTAELNF